MSSEDKKPKSNNRGKDKVNKEEKPIEDYMNENPFLEEDKVSKVKESNVEECAAIEKEAKELEKKLKELEEKKAANKILTEKLEAFKKERTEFCFKMVFDNGVFDHERTRRYFLSTIKNMNKGKLLDKYALLEWYNEGSCVQFRLNKPYKFNFAYKKIEASQWGCGFTIVQLRMDHFWEDVKGTYN